MRGVNTRVAITTVRVHMTARPGSTVERRARRGSRPQVRRRSARTPRVGPQSEQVGMVAPVGRHLDHPADQQCRSLDGQRRDHQRRQDRVVGQHPPARPRRRGPVGFAHPEASRELDVVRPRLSGAGSERSPEDLLHVLDHVRHGEHHHVVPAPQLGATTADVRLAVAHDGADQHVLGQSELGQRPLRRPDCPPTTSNSRTSASPSRKVATCGHAAPDEPQHRVGGGRAG